MRASWNDYAYVQNLAVNGVDPAGLFCIDVRLPFLWKLCGPTGKVCTRCWDKKWTDECGRKRKCHRECGRIDIGFACSVSGETLMMFEIGGLSAFQQFLGDTMLTIQSNVVDYLLQWEPEGKCEEGCPERHETKDVRLCGSICIGFWEGQCCAGLGAGHGGIGFADCSGHATACWPSLELSLTYTESYCY